MNQSEVFDDLSCRFIINNPWEEFASFERVLFQIEQAHWFYEVVIAVYDTLLGCNADARCTHKTVERFCCLLD
jgi:hypothetical protein